jgi:hypothetical protein
MKERHPSSPPSVGGWRTDRVRARLDVRRYAYRHLAAFGASHHRYALGPALPTGSMALCHFGCGAVFRLVVTGPGRGQVWFDDRGSDGGISPAAADFRTWYLDWLAEREAAPHGRRKISP